MDSNQNTGTDMQEALKYVIEQSKKVVEDSTRESRDHISALNLIRDCVFTQVHVINSITGATTGPL